MQIVLATNNQNKIKEIKRMFPNIDFILPSDLGFGEDIEENGTTFEENSEIKALALRSFTKLPILADDSGLCVEALNLAPGIYSARYASNHDAFKNNVKLLNELKNKRNKNAYYLCDVCLLEENSIRPIHFCDKCDGVIIDIPKGINGFAYDPYFYMPKLQKTMAELSLDEKNEYSHRGKAFRSAINYLLKLNP